MADAPTTVDPWLVALDVDGTVVDYDQRLSPRVRAAVGAVRDAGHHVVVSTGRSIMGTERVLADLGLTTGFSVCSNGAVTVALDPAQDRGWRMHRTVTFDARPAVELLRRELPDALFAVEVTGVGTRVTGDWPEGELSGRLFTVPFEELLDGETTRVVVRSPDRTADHFVELAERIGLHGVTYAVGYTAWLDIAPEGVTKASALEEVRREFGVASGRTLAAGDGRNDLEMLAWAARSVAMGNAPAQVRAAAGEVAATVHEDGLAVVLEGLVGT